MLIKNYLVNCAMYDKNYIKIKKLNKKVLQIYRLRNIRIIECINKMVDYSRHTTKNVLKITLVLQLMLRIAIHVA